MVTDGARFGAAPADGDFVDAEWRVLEAVVAARPGAIQLRDKGLEGGPMLRRARRLAAACRASGTKLLVNGRIDVALACGADGVHLPGDGLPTSEARRLLVPPAIVGRSLHDPAEIPAAEGADYVLFGPVFDTPSKRRFGPPQGLERLAAFCSSCPVPVVAVGGIDAARVAAVRAAGAAGVAVIGAVLAAESPGQAVASLLDALGA